MLTLPLIAAAITLAGDSVATITPCAGDSFGLRASKVHVGDGAVIENGVIVVTGGLISHVGAEAPDGVQVTEVDGEIAPGFIAMRDDTGARSENNETTRKFTPTADVSRAFDPEHPAWAHLVSQGVTSVLMTPASSRIAGGLDALVSPATGEVIKRGAALHLGMSSRSLSSFVEPTSYAGLYGHLENYFSKADKTSPFARAKAGSLPVMMEAFSKQEVARVASFAMKHGLTGAIFGAPEAGEQIELLKASGLGIVFEPMAAGATNDTVDSAKALQAAGIAFAFAADASNRGPAAMRMTAAACIRGGLDAGGALSAMTQTAAGLLGVSKTHGTIAAGKVADFVVWSGSPTDLTSRANQVYAGGKLVHSASSPSSNQRTR